jgi:hypothetical protein
MTSIQATGSTFHAPPKPPAAPKAEFGESAQVERQEAVAGTKEVGESASLGTKVNTTA